MRLNAPYWPSAAYLLSAAVMAGLGAALLTPSLRWLIASYAIAVMLFSFAAGSQMWLSERVTGLWYNDAYRLAAMLPVIAVPLAALGISAVARLVGQHRPFVSLPAGSVGVSLVVLLFLGSAGLYRSEVEGRLVINNRLTHSQEDSPLVTLTERDFYREVAGLVERGAVIAGNPWDGSTLVWALGERESLFPHLSGNWSEDRQTLAERLNRAVSDPEVCEAADRLAVRYVLDSGPFFREGPRADSYPGFEGLETAEGFEVIAEEGETHLYLITACEGGS